jgi:hypothetical protein
MKTNPMKLRPRNPVVMPARQRRAGIHAPSRKARRRVEQLALERELRALDAAP